MIDTLLKAVPGIQVTRIGLRYVNALQPSHGFSSFWDMNLTVEVDGQRPAETMAANYRFPAGSNCEVQVSIAHPTYVNGPLIPGSVALVDVDVFTPQPVGSVSKDMLLQWLETAHTAEKQAFFKLWAFRQAYSSKVRLMGLMTAAVATTIGSVTTLAPFPTKAPDCYPQLISLPSMAMPSADIVLTQLAFSKVADQVWHDIAWDALASSTKQLYAL